MVVGCSVFRSTFWRWDEFYVHVSLLVDGFSGQVNHGRLRLRNLVIYRFLLGMNEGFAFPR
jgi:hypothetical protein